MIATRIKAVRMSISIIDFILSYITFGHLSLLNDVTNSAEIVLYNSQNCNIQSACVKKKSLTKVAPNESNESSYFIIITWKPIW